MLYKKRFKPLWACVLHIACLQHQRLNIAGFRLCWAFCSAFWAIWNTQAIGESLNPITQPHGESIPPEIPPRGKSISPEKYSHYLGLYRFGANGRHSCSWTMCAWHWVSRKLDKCRIHQLEMTNVAAVPEEFKHSSCLHCLSVAKGSIQETVCYGYISS